MGHWICTTCGTQFAQSQIPPQACPICSDKRQYIGNEGQKWTTLAAMQSGDSHNVYKEYEPGLIGIGTEPTFAIGQRALLLQTDQGNILWDCITYLDNDTVAVIQQRGGLKAIAISHPHFYTTMVEWAEQFDAPIYLHEANRRWVMRPSERITYWPGETLSLKKGVTMMRLGGHFSGSTVLHWSDRASGKGILLTGDTIQVVADRNWVSFMYSYPNLIPLPAAAIRRIRDGIAPYSFEHLYGMRFESVVASDAKNIVLKSAERYMQALEERLT